MATVISFSKWLETRDSALAETIQNEAGGFAHWAAYPMMMAALGTSVARSAIPEVPGHEEPEVPMSAPANRTYGPESEQHPGAPEKQHGGHHDDTDELGHYVAESLMRRIYLVKNKVENALSRSGMPFKGWLLMLATKFFGNVVHSVTHLGTLLSKIPAAAERFVKHVEENGKEVIHHMGEKMRDPFGGEGFPADAAPTILAHKQRSFPSFPGREPYGPRGGYGMGTTPPRVIDRMHRRQHRG